MSSPVPDSDPDYYDVVFLHPDLGIGGAERAIVDAAVALQRAPPPLPTGDDESSDFESQEGVRRRTGRGVNAADTGSSREPAINGTGGSSSSGGYRVLLITAHHDPTRCFDETRDGTLRVIVAGSRIPRSIFGMIILSVISVNCSITRTNTEYWS